MIVNIRLEVTDEQRVNLASLLAGKLVKRLATRAEFNEFVAAHVARLNGEQGQAEKPAPTSLHAEPREKSGLTLLLEASGQVPGAVSRAEGEDIEAIEKHGTGIGVGLGEEVAPLRRAISHVNWAMFSMANTVRFLDRLGASFTGMSEAERLRDEIASFRDCLVAENDREAA